MTRSRMTLGDVFGESLAAVTSRPARAVFTMLGTILGIGTLVVITCLTATLQGQVSAAFDSLTATTVNIHDARTDSRHQDFPFTKAAEQRIASLHGVVASGVRWTVKLPSGSVSSEPSTTLDGPQIGVTAASASLWKVIEPTVKSGRTYGSFQDQANARVVVLGASAAKLLNITSVENQPAIYLAGEPYTVVGILGRLSREQDLQLSAIIPAGTAALRWGMPDQKAGATLVVATQLGAALQIASEAKIATSILAPSSVHVVSPPDPRSLRDAVSGDLASLLIILALVCLFIGTVGIANTTLVAVVERTPELGLRRALGAGKRHVAMQVLLESGLLGLIGGMVGSGTGILTLIAMSIVKGWAPVVDPAVAFGAPLVGLVIGALAGAYPAWRAARIEPSMALRR